MPHVEEAGTTKGDDRRSLIWVGNDLDPEDVRECPSAEARVIAISRALMH
jgi:hypothetical protein